MIHACVFAYTCAHVPVSVRMAVCAMVCRWASGDNLKCPPSLSPLFEAESCFIAAYQTRSVDFWGFCHCLTVYQRSVRVADGYFCLQLYMSLWLQTQVLTLANKVSALPTEPSSHPSNHDVLLFLGAGD